MKGFYASLLILTILIACGTSPEPGYYMLSPVPGVVKPEVATALKIRRPSFANYLDRSGFVRQQNEYQIIIESGRNWAEPLDRMFNRIFVADLRQRLPASQVVTEGEFKPINPRFIVDANIVHFNQVANGDVVLEGELVVKDKLGAAPPAFIPIKFTTSTGLSPQSVAAALSQLIGDTADRLVERINVPQ